MLGLVLGLIALIFVGYELVERIWLQGADARLIHALHILRGIGSTLLVSGVVAWFLARMGKSSLPEAAGAGLNLGEAGSRLDWFIQMRWLAILGAATAVFLSQHVLQLLPKEVSRPLWLGVAALLATNLAFLKTKARLRSLRAHLLTQLVSDLLILTYLLHFSGGIENPLFMLYAFHVVLAGILLPRKDAFLVTGGAVALFLFLGLGEYSRILEHYRSSLILHAPGAGPPCPARQFSFVSGISGAFIILLSGIAYFTTAIMQRLRESHQQFLKTEKLSVLGQLVAYIVHEINNPIGIISTRMRLAQSRPMEDLSPEFLKETLQIVDRQAGRVGGIIQTLLGFFKGRAKPKTVVNLNQALLDALFMLEYKILRAGIAVERSLSPSLPAVLGNHNDFVHAFLNLLGNAVDAMPRGGRLKLTTRFSDSQVEVVISDTGEGIPEENFSKIFDPFFTTKPQDRGTGLGLPVSLALVKSCGGEIRVQSQPGSGSSFFVVLPVQTSASKPERDPRWTTSGAKDLAGSK
ncbi:MAG: hypothetical protein HY402_05385 [Elusimicrobia bacterium]|nr:hypothetical protein [Elusimicrobiota bacterium]